MDIHHFRQKFIDEAIDLLHKLDAELLALENESSSEGNIDQVFRVMHTLKGSSGMFGFTKISEITHELESLYDKVRQGYLKISQPLLDLTFSVGDHIKNLLNDYDLVEQQNIIDNNTLTNQIAAFFQDLSVSNAVTQPLVKMKSGDENTFHILFNPDDSIIKRCINLSYTFHDLFQLGHYQIHPPTGVSESLYWNIFLTTQKSYEDIEDALIFVMDYCKIRKVADFDIFNESNLEGRDSEIENAEKQFRQNNFNNRPIDVDDAQNLKSLDVVHVAVSHDFGQNRRIHVEASKLDNLMYLVSELVTARSELLLSINDNYSFKTIEAAERIDKLSKLFSDTALSIRLVSMEEMLSRFRRLVRDLAKSLGKQVEFVTEGADTELDKNIIDAIAEPVMHLVRNCIDHGIEMPEIRRSRGKSEVGHVFFSAYKAGNYVYVKIGDDGNGINSEAVLRKAVDKGFIPEDAVLSDKEIYDLIFLPGFSTASVVSEVSGRGVGMDIVWRKIKEIRGEVTVESTPLQGTTFFIKLQQTISIIDTLLVSANSSKYAIPIEDVEICGLELHSNILNRQSNLIEFNKELIPYVSLSKHLQGHQAMSESVKLIIINKQEHRYAIVADQIIGEFQAVVKPLGSAFAGQDFLSGASVYGDGSIVLLLDTEKLKKLL